MAEVISHWSTLVDDFNTSGKEFYEAVEKAIEEREVPDTIADSIVYKEGGLFSGKREYLRIQRERIVFDLCAAKYGNGFFFSWWLAREKPRGGWFVFLVFVLATMIWASLLMRSVTASMTRSWVGGSDGGFATILLFGAPIVLLGLMALVRYGETDIDEDYIVGIPFLGWLYVKLFNPFTYYKLDSAIMFQTSVSRAVNDVINNVLAEQGLKTLTEEQFKPTVRDLAR